MGLLDFLRGDSTAKPTKGKAAAKPIAAIDSPIPPVDTRPDQPEELSEHFRKECVSVFMTDEGRSLLSGVDTYGTISVMVRKTRKNDVDGDYCVKLPDGRVLGHLMQNDVDRALVKTRGEISAEVVGPIYAGYDYPRLYIPLSEEAKRRQELKIWINVDGSKWTGQQEVRAESGEILESRKGSGKPSYVIVADNMRLCEITSRMGCYEDIAERAKYPLRLVIAEPRTSDYGPYWRLGLYF